MSSFVEVKDAAIDKALELIDAIEASTDDGGEKVNQSQAVMNLINAASIANSEASQSTWEKQQEGVGHG